MNIILLGPQGSGKGTQARILIEKFGFFYFESGEFLRKIAKDNEELRKSLSEGKMVPDEEMTSYLKAFLDEKGLYDDIIFDGFPRTVTQYNFLKDWLSQKNVSLNLALVLEIGEEETVRRLSSRRMDPATGKIYNLITDLPPDGIDQATLIQREDDKPEAIKKRLALYRELTEPLISELKKDGVTVVEIDGERPIEAIASDITKLIEERNK